MIFARSARTSIALITLAALLLCSAVSTVQAGHGGVAGGDLASGGTAYRQAAADGSDSEGPAGTCCDSAQAITEPFRLSSDPPAAVVALAVAFEAPCATFESSLHPVSVPFSGAPPPLHLLHCRLRN